MGVRSLLVSPLARDDLADIYRYGNKTWGLTQSAAYLTKLKDQLWLLLDYPMMGLDRSKLFANTRSIPVESHIIFYRLNENLVEIIRVLHSRQDPERHI